MSEWFWLGIEARYYGYCVGELLVMLALSHVAPGPNAVADIYRAYRAVRGHVPNERRAGHGAEGNGDQH